MIERRRIVEARQRVADGIDPVRVRPRPNGDARGRGGHMGIAAQVVVRDRVMPGSGAVVATQPVAPIIAHPPLLREAAGRLKGARVRVHTKIPAADVHLPPAGNSMDDSAQQTIRAVNPIIQPQAQAVDPRLVILRVEHHCAHFTARTEAGQRLAVLLYFDTAGVRVKA